MKKTYQFRIYPNKTTVSNTLNAFELCRQLYNLCLEQRIYSWKQRKISLSCYDQIKQLPELKNEFPEYKQVPSQSFQDVVERVDKAYKNFFNRFNLGLGKGFPRFKSFNQYNSITLKQAGWRLTGNYLIIQKFGKFKVKFHRSIPKEALIKTITIKRTLSNKWFVSFSLDNVPQNILPNNNEIIGIDVGCISFLTDSNGLKVNNPRFIKKAQTRITQLQQKLDKQHKGSNRRQKTKYQIAKKFEKVCNQRKDFHFKVANHYVKHYGTIVHEDMKSWVTEYKSRNKSMRDVAWFDFFEILKVKAESAGRQIFRVNPRNTSQMCSKCGQIVYKDLSVRIHNCPFCDLILDRDENAALNILRLGISLRNSVLVIPRSPNL